MKAKVDHEKVKEIFSEAIELPLDEQADFLISVCRNDENLLREVESLLKARRKSKNFLEDVSAPNVLHGSINKNDQLIGQKIDKYRLVKEIGRGGMGVVFLAEREDFRQQVALKLIKRGMDSDAILERFSREREILASLNHPFIARFLDGGTTENGSPFFVMEFVEGISFDKYCRQKNLNVEQKLELFIKICEAVSFAHQKLIIHRDLKPSNILIDENDNPKLLDFGIAKLLNSNEISQTQTQQKALTPAYASPEQIRGETVDTTSDVFSLGKILSGILQNDKSNKDLQAILQTSMREESIRRYASVEKFSDDIRRYLNGLPISAQKDTFSYRAKKFVQRNYLPVIVATLFILTLLTGLTAVILENQKTQREHTKAEQRFNDVRTLANSFMFEFHDAIENLPGSTPARQLVVSRALEYLNKLNQESADDPALQRELATAYEKVGRIQGNSYYSNLGDTNGAMQSYQKSLEIRQKLATADSTNPELQNELANSLEGVGDMFYTIDDLKNGLSNYQNALTIRENLAQTDSGNLQYQSSLADIYAKIGDISGFEGYANLGDTKSSLDFYEKAVATNEKLVQAEPNNSKFRQNFGLRLTNLGMLYRTVGKTKEAIDKFEKSDAIFKNLISAEPNNFELQFDLLTNNVSRRYALADDEQIDESINLMRETLKTLEEMQTTDSKNALLKRSLGVAYNSLSRSFLQKKDYPQAIENAKNALNIVEKLLQANPESGENQTDLVHTLEFLAEAQFSARDYNSALSNYQRSLSLAQKNLENGSSNARTQDDISICLAGIGNILTTKGNFDEALRDFQKAISIAEKNASDSPVNALLRSRLALRYFEMGKIYEQMTEKNKLKNDSLKDAKSCYQKSYDIWSEMQKGGILNKVDSVNLQTVTISLSKLNL
ncbi:MAG TPA: protein kinase [Pyrinomonadaceae bacterium]|nr:protein kinase [Pyrinomonadaceae bacterium]